MNGGFHRRHAVHRAGCTCRVLVLRGMYSVEMIFRVAPRLPACSVPVHMIGKLAQRVPAPLIMLPVANIHVRFGSSHRHINALSMKATRHPTRFVPAEDLESLPILVSAESELNEKGRPRISPAAGDCFLPRVEAFLLCSHLPPVECHGEVRFSLFTSSAAVSRTRRQKPSHE